MSNHCHRHSPSCTELFVSDVDEPCDGSGKSGARALYVVRAMDRMRDESVQVKVDPNTM